MLLVAKPLKIAAATSPRATPCALASLFSGFRVARGARSDKMVKFLKVRRRFGGPCDGGVLHRSAVTPDIRSVPHPCSPVRW
jgi:hypothetical protein